MKKIYCKDCFWLREYKHVLYGYDKNCSQDKCFKGGIEDTDTPIRRREIDTTTRVMGSDGLNKNNDCPDFREATNWEKFKRIFDIRMEP